MKKALVGALAACTFAFAGAASAQVDCSTITTIGAWSAAGSCVQDDKVWAYVGSSLGAGVGVSFTEPVNDVHVLQITGFDLSNVAGFWSLDYTITVTDPLLHIVSLDAGSDCPGCAAAVGTQSTLSKDVTGDEAFNLTVLDGVGQSQGGLDADFLAVHETFNIAQGWNLLSVSNVFTQVPRQRVPEPSTLVLLGLAALGLAGVRRVRR